jgi:LysM repeat protein
MVTLALGVAVGAATLVVGHEVVKDLKTDKAETKPVVSPKPLVSGAKAPNRAQTLATRFEQAKKEYYEAAARNDPQAKQKLDVMSRARWEYQQEIDRLKLAAVKASASPSGSSGQKNPFDDDNTVQAVGVPTGGTTAASSGVSAAESPSSSAPAVVPAAGTSAKQISLEYYRVQSGDSLSKICQTYYGDSGMWAHILQYQIPSIAATPNLIFPGQLIALPRNFVTGGTGNSGASGTDATGTITAAPPAPQGDESWQTSFQKEYLISDYSLTNTNTMTVAQIQSFLEKKGSVLAKPYNGSTPAKMIFDAAKKHGINPQVLLARLQCEQGLISAKSATQKQLDWALGVGAYDSGNWNSKYKGFDKQIDGAAATYKRHYLDAKKKLDAGQAVTMEIDGQQVKVKNAATYAFYKYCPHFNGNKLFYDVWRGYSKSF